MKLLTLLAITIFASHSIASLSSIGDEKGVFQLPNLPYKTNALEPAIDTQTMEIHHGKHHKAYVDNLNKALPNNDKKLIDIITKIKRYPDAVRNNAGGHWNHTFFWTLLTPNKEENKLSEKMTKLLSDNFGSVEEFKKQFEQAATSQFGSGWAWLIVTKKGKFKITSTPNQDNPLMNIAKEKGTPIFGIDVWEHAYYLKYQNMRGAYLGQVWNVVNWSQVEKYYEEAIKL